MVSNRKSRNFNGCWTCRLRKVKCDLQRPYCNRCQRAKLTCLGYNIKLGWSAPLSVKNNQLIQLGDENLDNFQRRNIDLVKFPDDMYYSTYKELNSKLETLEKFGGTVGPFSVYKITLELRQINGFENSLIHSNLIDYAKLTILAIKGINYQFNQQNMLHILYPKFFPNLDSDDWIPNKLILKKLFNFDDEQLHLTNLLRQLLNFDSKIFSFNRMYFKPNYYDFFVIPYLKQILLEYFLCSFTNWIDDNYDDKISNIKLAITYLILALSSYHKSNKNVIELDLYIQLSIELRKLGVTILNKHLDSYDDEEEEQQGEQQENEEGHEQEQEVEKKQFATRTINYEYEQGLLLAILLQIELDGCFSVYENYELMFAIADNIIKNKFIKYRLSNLVKFLINVFKIWYIFFESTQSVNMFNYEINERDEIINYRDLNENYDLADSNDENDDDDDDDDETFKPTIKNLIISNKPNYSPLSFSISFNKRDLDGYNEAAVDEQPATKTIVSKQKTPNFKLDGFFDLSMVYLMYGLPKSILDLLHEITHLTNHKNIFRRKNVFPRNFPRICAETYDNLLNWDINEYMSLDLTISSHKQIYLYGNSFHKALIVYSNRLIHEHPVKSYQNVIIESLNYLIELLEVESEINVKPLFWILFVCGSDILDKFWQVKIDKILNLAGKYSRQFNYWRGKQILYEIWKRREEGDEIGFMDVIREWDNILFLG